MPHSMADSLPCPVCGKPIATVADHRPATFPFCTDHCRLRDLGAWFAGAYVVAGGAADESEPAAIPARLRSRTP